jgi:hypothetical protein
MSRTRSLQARQWGECMLLFKTFNCFAPFNRCALFKSSISGDELNDLNGLKDWNLFETA